jgi:hypothetical protein
MRPQADDNRRHKPGDLQLPRQRKRRPLIKHVKQAHRIKRDFVREVQQRRDASGPLCAIIADQVSSISRTSSLPASSFSALRPALRIL